MPGTDLLQVQRAFSPVLPTTRTGIPRVGETLPGQHGVMCESARVNLLFNPSAKVDLTSILAVGAGAAVTRDTTIGLQIGTSAKTVCDGTVAAQGYSNQTNVPLGLGTYIGSAWVYSRAGGEAVTVYARANPTAGALIQTSQAYTLKAGWQRLIAPALSIPQGTSAYATNVYVRTTAAQACTFWVADAQLEIGVQSNAADVFPTSFIDGSATPASAYSWEATGTAVLTNGSFESGLTGWIAESGMVAAAVTTQHFIGASSCSLSGGGDLAQIVTANVSAGQVWTLSGAYYNPSALTGTPRISIYAEDGSGNALAVYTYNVPLTALPGWQTFALTTGQTPTNTVKLVIFVFNGGATDPAWYVDALQLEHRGHATTFANPGTVLGSSAVRAETLCRYTLPAAVAGQYSVMGWAKLDFTPTATTNYHFLASGAPVPSFSLNNLQLNVFDGTTYIAINPITPFVAGDVIAYGVLMDPVGLTTQAWLYHNGALQMSPANSRASVPVMTDLCVGNHYTAPGDNTPDWAGNSFVGPVAVFNGLLSTNDIQRYIDLGTFDPTRDPRIQTVSGYGSSAQGLLFWQAGISNASGVVQPIGSYTGQVRTDDGQGNALPGNQRRFVLLLAENPNYDGVGIGQQVGLDTTDSSIGLTDVWTVTALHSSDPSQIDLICTHA